MQTVRTALATGREYTTVGVWARRHDADAERDRERDCTKSKCAASASAAGSAPAPAHAREAERRPRPTEREPATPTRLSFLGHSFCKFASACPPSYPRGYGRPADPLRGCTTIAVAPLTSAVIAPTMSAFGARGGRHAPMAQPMAPPAMVELAGLSLPKMRPVRHSNPL